MSQDQPKPPPEKPEFPTPGPKPDVGQSESALQQVNRTLRQAWSRAQPVLRSQSIKVLRATIQLLEAVLTKLEVPPKAISTEDFAKPVQSTATGESAESQTAPGAPSASGKSPDQPTPASSFESTLDKLRPRLEQLQRWWNTALTKIRSWLPESINQKLSDTALTGAIAGILVILLWTTSALFPGKPSPKIANVPPPQRNLPAPDLTAPPELRVPEKPQPIGVSPPASGPVVTPSPTLVLSPELQRIADIQTQVAEVGNQYANYLIQSVQTNPQESRLTAKTSNSWYNLSSSQQDTLADELLNRSQKLNFNKLEIVDAKGTLLARSPVVGDNMVILQRQIASRELTPS